jgi:galactitol-specific phosphotransferase system IIC component
VVAAGGTYLGYTFGSGLGSTGLTEWFSAMIALALAILILIVLVVVAVLIRWKSTSRDPALRSVIRVGALFVAGIGIGWVLSQFFASA